MRRLQRCRGRALRTGRRRRSLCWPWAPPLAPRPRFPWLKRKPDCGILTRARVFPKGRCAESVHVRFEAFASQMSALAAGRGCTGPSPSHVTAGVTARTGAAAGGIRAGGWVRARAPRPRTPGRPSSSSRPRPRCPTRSPVLRPCSSPERKLQTQGGVRNSGRDPRRPRPLLPRGTSHGSAAQWRRREMHARTHTPTSRASAHVHTHPNLTRICPHAHAPQPHAHLPMCTRTSTSHTSAHVHMHTPQPRAHQPTCRHLLVASSKIRRLRSPPHRE